MLETPNEATLARLRSLCLSLPETSETASWGHPNFKAGKKTFVEMGLDRAYAGSPSRANVAHGNEMLDRLAAMVAGEILAAMGLAGDAT